MSEWSPDSRWEPEPTSVWDEFRMWLDRKKDYQERVSRWGKRHGQHTWCWCPTCGSDLVGNPSTQCSDTDLVRYTCGWCHEETVWDFDSYPVPVRLK